MGENGQQSIESWSIDIYEGNNLEENLQLGSDCCIYRVPRYLCKLNEETYTPKLISIGPLHYGRKEFMGMEDQKKRFWSKFWKRVNEQILEEFKTFIENHEQRIRDHYSVFSTLESSEYVAMIQRDAVFIVELFLRSCNYNYEFLIDSPFPGISTTTDLLLLENQVPYFVLNHLYNIAFPSRETQPSFFHLSLNFFNGVVKFNMLSLLVEPVQVKHFTDLVRCAFVMGVRFQPALNEDRINEDRIFDLPNATKLNNSGLNFRGIKGECYLDITLGRKRGKWLPCFKVTELRIPCIEIYDETEGLFRNMMALELFHYPTETHICNYVHLLGCLIKTVKDVDLFVKKEIIVNCVDDNEVIMKMFNRLNTYMIFRNSFCFRNSTYYDIVEKMKAHYKYPSNYAKATLTDKVTFATTFLMILTVIQTICSVKQIF